jgi:ADP-ribosylglycohydrolase
MASDDRDTRRERARRSLDGLSVGDAFGERFFQEPGVVKMLLEKRATPAPPWRWTDDTAMALSIVEVLEAHGAIVPGVLAETFARRYRSGSAR